MIQSLAIAPTVIDLGNHYEIGFGFYADIFAIGDRAYKVFRTGPQYPPKYTDDERRHVFRRQCEAYRLAASDPWLRQHVADFHGVCQIEDVIDAKGRSLKSSYLLDCCYAMELFSRDEEDLKTTHELVRKHEHIKIACMRFVQLGIAIHDASVFRYANLDRFKFIDIELDEHRRKANN